MGNHYVPQFYLRGFESEGALWAYDRSDHRCFKTQPKVVANENGMYPDDLESRLATNIEYPANEAIIKIRNRLSITPEEKLILAKYIIVLWKRVPKARDRVIERVPSVAADVHENLNKELDTLLLHKPEMISKVEGWRDEIGEVIAKHKANPPPELWHGGIESETSPRVVDTLASMCWVFLYRDDLQFLTSDNPVFFFEFEGIGKPTSELTIPLSSSVTLWASRRPQVEGTFLPASPSAVREINRRTVHNSTRFLYFERNEQWIAPFVKKGSWKLTRLL